ncbi:choice-of-anchor M domain-containing protein [Plantactinospora sp. WMMC1484]|uniref:choice-of-anchor M domain-containing protein n=1 Tax=Plantactinospora sp. WMMC1484 TaxID=3404122 RepID=UPI003BF58D79
MTAVLAVLASTGLLGPVNVASATAGPAPASGTRTVLSDTHVDVVAVGASAGQLTFNTKADLERTGTRLYPEDVIVNVEDAARTTVPGDPVYSFLGEPGDAVWIAPEARRDGVVWLGFDTADVPAGAVERDSVEIALTGVDGPGQVEVWTASGLGLNRIFSSQATGAANSLTMQAAGHQHANWGFTEPGRYQLTFAVKAVIGGTTQTKAATIRFHVGPMPPATQTTTTLTVTPAQATVGQPVVLSAAVSPATASGAVEFVAGSTVLGHTQLTGGAAVLETTQIPLGRQTITARYVPTWTDEFGPSSSDAVEVNVRQPGSGADFEITGLRESYQAGDTMRLSVSGYPLGDNQNIRWTATSPDPEQGTLTLTSVSKPDPLSMERVVTTAYDGWEIQAQVRTGSAVVATTAPVRLHVGGTDAGSGVEIIIEPIQSNYYWGVAVPLVATHRPLAEGERLQWVQRPAVGGLTWQDTNPTYGPVGDGPWSVVSNFMQYQEFALQLRAADGTVLGESAPQHYSLTIRSVELQGLRSIYRVGERAELSASVSPDLGDGLYYLWELWGEGNDRMTVDGGARLSSAAFDVTEAMMNRTLYLRVHSRTTDQLVGYVRVPFNVTNVAEGDQVLAMAPLGGHYHQGTPINLDLTAEPALASSDVTRYWWKRSDWDDFRQIPGATGLSHVITAEQALSGTQIKADAVNSSGEVLATTDTQTITVDDHGAGPVQGVIIEGLAPSYTAGDDAVLTARVSPSSVLDRFTWLVKKAGETEPIAVAGANGSRLELPLTTDLDGAQVTAQLTFDDGRVYVTSTPVTLNVTGSEPPQAATQQIVATLRESDGSLVVSVDADDNVVQMSDFELGTAGDLWASSGALRPVTVTDTRSGAPGWTVSGQVSDFTANAEVLKGRYLGWTPLVAEQPDGGGVTPGGQVAPGLHGGNGLSVGSPLAIAPPGAGFGTSKLGAGLVIETPTTLAPGTYAGTITFTVI